MTTYTVKQTGGDYSTLNSALAAVSTGDIISIEGEWTVDDTVPCVVGDDDITIEIGDSDAAHPGYWDTSTNHYRLVVSGTSAADHVFVLNGTGCVIDGLAIKQNGTGASIEGVRVNNHGTNTIKNCLITSSANGLDQDGVYSYYTVNPTITIENCVIWGWSRRGVGFDQLDVHSGTTIYEINSCVIYGNGSEFEQLSNGIGLYNSKSTAKTIYVYIHNSLVMGNNVGGNSDAEDITSRKGVARYAYPTVHINVSYSIDSDGSIGATGITDNDGNLTNRTAIDEPDPGNGDWVMFKDVTTSPYDFRLAGNVENDAQDAHTTATAEGLTIPSYDFVGMSRPQNISYDIGAFEIEAHVLVAEGIVIGPVAENPIATQTHILTGIGIVTDPPWVLIPELTVGHVLIGLGLRIIPSVVEASIAQVHILNASDVTTNPETGAPDISHGSLLTSVGIGIGPVVGTVSIEQTHGLSAIGIVSEAVVDSPVVAQTHELLGSIITVTPSVSSPDAGQEYILTSIGVLTTPILNTAHAGTVYYLTGVGVATSSPSITKPSMAVTDILGAKGLVVGPPVVDTSSLTTTHVLSTVGIASISVVGNLSIGQTHSLAIRDIVTAPGVYIPILRQEHALASIGVAIVPEVGRTAFLPILGILDIIFTVGYVDAVFTASYVDVTTKFYKPEANFSTYTKE